MRESGPVLDALATHLLSGRVTPNAHRPHGSDGMHDGLALRSAPTRHRRRLRVSARIDPTRRAP